MQNHKPITPQSRLSFEDQIEVGWHQSERGDIIDGDSVFKEIHLLSQLRRKAKRDNPDSPAPINV